jgi:hypothetical protein
MATDNDSSQMCEHQWMMMMMVVVVAKMQRKNRAASNNLSVFFSRAHSKGFVQHFKGTYCLHLQGE